MLKVKERVKSTCLDGADCSKITDVQDSSYSGQRYQYPKSPSSTEHYRGSSEIKFTITAPIDFFSKNKLYLEPKVSTEPNWSLKKDPSVGCSGAYYEYEKVEARYKIVANRLLV